MAAYTERPIIFALSNSRAPADANPAGLIARTDGRAPIATGGPFRAATLSSVTYVAAQVNDARLQPGLGGGAIVSRGGRIGEDPLAAATAVFSQVIVPRSGGSLVPPIDCLRSVPETVAVAVIETGDGERIAGVKRSDLATQARGAMWRPECQRVPACRSRA